MTARVLAEWGRGPISSFAAILSGKIWKHVKNIAGSKGLRPLAGAGAEPRLSSKCLRITIQPSIDFPGITAWYVGF